MTEASLFDKKQRQREKTDKNLKILISILRMTAISQNNEKTPRMTMTM
jgi:hypothetical protein